MKKFMKKSVSLLMAGAMVFLPVSMSAQAKEVPNNTKIVNTVTEKVFGNAKIKGNGVRIRKGPGTSATVVGLLYKGDRVQADYQAYGDGKWWYHCKTQSGLEGYIAVEYLDFN
ncbi:MAG: SH3 domain-containing protein [Lachnospiraceae bacterium]|nr:SH3 domain-containing protein [Lachnospiraceae bacterium]